jgi:hypothetical protein
VGGFYSAARQTLLLWSGSQSEGYLLESLCPSTIAQTRRCIYGPTPPLQARKRQTVQNRINSLSGEQTHTHIYTHAHTHAHTHCHTLISSSGLFPDSHVMGSVGQGLRIRSLLFFFDCLLLYLFGPGLGSIPFQSQSFQKVNQIPIPHFPN